MRPWRGVQQHDASVDVPELKHNATRSHGRAASLTDRPSAMN
jgi:hypothetical protein